MQFAAHATIGLPANSAAWVGADQAAQADLTQLRNSWGPQTLVNVTESALLSAVSDLPVQPGPNGEPGSWCAHHVLEGILGRCLLPDAAVQQLTLAHIVTAAKLSVPTSKPPHADLLRADSLPPSAIQSQGGPTV